MFGWLRKMMGRSQAPVPTTDDLGLPSSWPSKVGHADSPSSDFSYSLPDATGPKQSPVRKATAMPPAKTRVAPTAGRRVDTRSRSTDDDDTVPSFNWGGGDDSPSSGDDASSSDDD